MPAAPAGPSPPSSEGKYGSLRVSYRILLHVAHQGRVRPDDLPSRGLTQTGMIEALGIGQGILAGPLQRLVLAGALSVERGHARGVDRRVKVYTLTPLGERIVRDLEHRRKPPSLRQAPADRRSAPGAESASIVRNQPGASH